MRRILGLLVVLVFIAGVFNVKAGSFDIKLNGVYSKQKSTNLTNFIGKKPVLVVFFYPQCPPCEKESSVINKIYKKYKGSIFVLGISLSKDRYDIEDFIDDLGIKYPIYRIANKNQLRNIGGILATPTSVLISKEGKIVCKVPGVIDYKVMSEKISRCIK